MQIISSDDGRKTGTTADHKFGGALVPGPFMAVGGFVSGPHGSQIRSPSPYWVSHFDDFEGDAGGLSARWIQRKGSNNPAAPAPLSGAIGGVCRFTSGAAGTGLAADENSLVQTLQWSCANGGMELQTRIKLSAITTCWAFLGFCDVASSVQIPIQSAASADTFTNNATNAVGFMFDTNMSTKNWWAVGVNAGVGATNQNLAIAPAATQYQTFRIGLDASGNASFFLNGNPIGTRMAAAYAPATIMTPILAVGKNSVAAAMTMDVDYAHVAMARNSDGAAT